MPHPTVTVVKTRHSFGCLGWAVILALLGPLFVVGACAALTALGLGVTAASGGPDAASETPAEPR